MIDLHQRSHQRLYRITKTGNWKQFALHRLRIHFPTRAHGGLRLSKSLSSASGFPFLYAGSRVDKAVLLLVTPP